MNQFKKRKKHFVNNNLKDIRSKIEILGRTIKTQKKKGEDTAELKKDWKI
jgi:hypothetical protein